MLLVLELDVIVVQGDFDGAAVRLDVVGEAFLAEAVDVGSEAGQVHGGVAFDDL